MSDFDNKELINNYEKNGFNVKTYKTIMSEKERKAKNAQIKYDILNIITPVYKILNKN